MNPQIIFEDDHILVLDKPPGLVVDRSATQTADTLEDWLAKYYDTLGSHSKQYPARMGIAHRLDKDTSGLILVAKTTAALADLQTQFKDRIIKKQYLALVHGNLEGTKTLEGEIGRNPGNREKFTVLEGGKEAQTIVEPVKRLQLTGDRLQEIFSDFNNIQIRKLERMEYSKFTLVKAFPKTGRTHQIRVHLKYINHPVVADQKYVGRKMSRLDKKWCQRMFLHASNIEFRHPVTKGWLKYFSPLPADLVGALNYLTDV